MNTTPLHSVWMAMQMVVIGLALPGSGPVLGQETLPMLRDGNAPRSHQELWADFDPRAEPLEVETLKEWEEDGVVLRIVRYRIGIFKGQKAMMAGVFGFPKDGTGLPGLVQIHGGGQYADHRAAFANAKRGYATISIAWAGRISAPGYRVNPAVVELFWEEKTNDPAYRVTTDWGTLDAYHAPCRNAGNAFARVAPASWTLDAVESPRNNPWFLCTLAARRALTFLEQQPEVDPEKLGVYGHSMGGKLTVMTAGADHRVVAAAPSCGGISNRTKDNLLYHSTLDDPVSLERISCPIVFLSPANDFHGRIDDLQRAVTEIASSQWRLTCAAHHNHQDTADYEVATQLWFDEHLKDAFTFPRTPVTTLALRTSQGVPSFSVTPDASKPVLSVDVYYTQQGQGAGTRNDRENTIARFWHHADARENGATWSADLPLLSTDMPLWVYANVTYPLDEPVTGAGYYYGLYRAAQFNLSSLMHQVTATELNAAGVRATVSPSRLIEAFETGWEKEWFSYKPEDWPCKTHKLHDEQWAAPPTAALAVDVQAETANTLVVGIDTYASEVQLEGDSRWQRIVLTPGHFQNAKGESMPDWQGRMELRLGHQETLRERVDGEEQTVQLGGAWKGGKPVFRRLRWIPGAE